MPVDGSATAKKRAWDEMAFSSGTNPTVWNGLRSELCYNTRL